MNLHAYPGFCFSFLVFLLVHGSLAYGQNAESKSEKQTQADAYFEAGSRAFREQKYKEAAVEFQKAYDTVPHPAVLANIGLSHDKAGHIAQAVVLYRQYFEAPVEHPQNELFSQRLAELELQVVDVAIECSENPCDIYSNGEKLGNSPLTTVLLPGEYTFEAFREDQQIGAISGILLAVGPKRKLRIAVLPPPSPKEEERTATTATPTPPPQTAEQIDTEKNLLWTSASPTNDTFLTLGAPFWVSAGVTVLSGAAIGIFGSLAVSRNTAWKKSGRTDEDLRQEGLQMELMTNVMIGITAAAAVTTGVFAIIDTVKSKKKERQKRLSIGPGSGLGLQGSF